MLKPDEVLNYFQGWNLDEESRRYLHGQYPRYAFLLNEIEKIIKGLRNPDSFRAVKILDIGPAYQTELMRRNFEGVIVDTLGFADVRFALRENERHFQFDLNDLPDKGSALSLRGYNLIVMAEVMEHLHISADIAFGQVHAWLNKKGYFIIQTPNALALRNRLNTKKINPSHVREYTLKELLSSVRKSGFEVIGYYCQNYHNKTSGIKTLIYNSLCNALPANFRDEIFICLRKA